jgi:LmbE family N-acetylglucosaminyl deacetylase
MVFPTRFHRTAVITALVGALVAGASLVLLRAQQTEQPAASLDGELAAVPLPQPASYALPLPEDRGQAAVEQVLKRLQTTASVLMIVAHPDDEDGGLLTYLSRGQGVRATLLTLNRGEGGQNIMSADENDALGLIRTNELLDADRYYGVKQLWGTEVDFGFSKTQKESFAQWGHQRVLYDAVLAVRRTRPEIIVSTFVGGVSDGHGQHQVSGEIAQEAFKAAADPNVFPDQLKDGLQPWQALAVYSRDPFARIGDGKMFDYATGEWAPVGFRNYVTGAWINGMISTDVTIPVGTWDPALGRSYIQIARQGWGQQKSQNGGANPTLSGPDSTGYHLWAVVPSAKAPASAAGEDNSLFHNSKVGIDTSIEGLARLASGNPPAWLTTGLRQIETGLQSLQADCPCKGQTATAHRLVPIYRNVLDLRARVAASSLDAKAKSDLLFELDAKIDQFQLAFKNLLGLDLTAFTSNGGEGNRNPFGDASPGEMPRSVTPGERFYVRVHTSHASSLVASGQVRLARVWLVSRSGSPWSAQDTGGLIDAAASAAPATGRAFRVQVSDDAQPTAPYFTRPNIEQAYYDISNPKWRGRPFMPWPLAAWAEFTFDGVPIRLGEVVQTLQRVPGPGGFFEPLVVTPAIGVSVDPQARILPLDGSALPVRVTVHAEAAASGTVDLKLPAGWRSDPAQAQFHLDSAGETDPLVFSVTPSGAETGAYTIQAVARSAGETYRTGWKSIGYPGLRPYNLYTPAVLKTRKVNVKMAAGLRIGYIMGSGDLVPDAIRALGVTPDLITPSELASGDLSAWNVIAIGIRAYAVRPGLAEAQSRLDDFVRRGGTLIVQYQSAAFPAPLPVTVSGRPPSSVVVETDPIKLLDPSNPLLTFPNKIASADFDGWVEERGHSFLESWDPGYTALTETADPGQAPQRGGLLVTHPGKGTYIYVAYALYRQLPELVPGSYRLLANLLSAGREPSGGSAPSQTAHP